MVMVIIVIQGIPDSEDRNYSISPSQSLKLLTQSLKSYKTVHYQNYVPGALENKCYPQFASNCKMT